jgi:hypothetical protein
MRTFLLSLASLLVVSCSNLPVPQPEPTGQGKRSDSLAATEILKQAARQQGNPWRNYQRVQVAYNGEWSTIAVKVQPVLTNPEFRKSSVEIYQPRLNRVTQVHTGPMGTKQVIRQLAKTQVTFNAKPADAEATAAAGLVADAYKIFLFGPSWLTVHGRDLRLLPDRTLDGEKCHLVAGRLSPGIGTATADDFIAWIGQDSRLMRRFQFTLNGLDVTRGADVDVTFSEHWKAPDGSIWPGHFVEYIQRPIHAKAHDWRMTSLTLNGRAGEIEVMPGPPLSPP